MQSLVRLRVFLLCCVLMIGINVLLIMGCLARAGFRAGETGSLSGCDAQYVAQTRCDYGFCAEKR
jgi:hypothetical protein